MKERIGSRVSNFSNTNSTFSLRTALAYLASTALLASGLVVGVATPASAAPCASGVAPSGSGTSLSPYLIATAADLIWISEQTANWNNQHFRQTANIDLGGCQFTPIGKNTTAHFKGTYDGRGFTIEGLYIRESTTYAGLFGDTNETAVFRNIGLIDVDIETTGTVAGAIVGRLTGSNAQIHNSFATGSVAGRDAIGGLVGQLWVGPLVSNSYSSASITITQNNGTGGGIAGTVVTSGRVTNVYARGPVSTATGITSTAMGGLVGGNVAATETAAFFDSDVSPLSNGIGTGRTTAQMTSLATFSAWDIVDSWEEFNFDSPDNYWGICSVENDGYPFLLWQFSAGDDPCVAAPSGSSEASAGVPGIFLYVAGPVGRTVGDSPVYYGADRVATASDYEVRVLSNGAGNPVIVSLSSGKLPMNGSIPSTMARLPQLDPGTYLVRMTGKHSSGRTLELTSVITVGPAGTFTSIGPNIPVIR